MEENGLLYVSIVISLIGLFLMFFISNNMNIDSVKVNSVSFEDVGRNVKICGEVKNIFISKNGHTFFKIKDETGELKSIIFNSTGISVNSKENNCLIGKIDVYENELEIVVNEVIND